MLHETITLSTNACLWPQSSFRYTDSCFFFFCFLNPRTFLFLSSETVSLSEILFFSQTILPPLKLFQISTGMLSELGVELLGKGRWLSGGPNTLGMLTATPLYYFHRMIIKMFVVFFLRQILCRRGFSPQCFKKFLQLFKVLAGNVFQF